MPTLALSASLTSSDLDRCTVRLDLSKAVVDAVALTYKAKANYDAAVKNKNIDFVECSSALMTARTHERQAERALRDHIEQHHCRL